MDMYKSEVIRRVAKEARLSQQIVANMLDASPYLIKEPSDRGGTITSSW
jgi:hypothetical protein